MNNVETTISGDTLVIKINLKAEGAPSKSGKTQLVATTGGFQSVPGAAGFGLSLNVTKAK